jgi:hypothetical protein
MSGGNGFLGVGGYYNATASTGAYRPTSGFESGFSIDFIGTGGGGASEYAGINGGGGAGGGAGSGAGGFPGGGGGGTSATGGFGLVIVEW